jgi:hypothetical protein
LLKPVPRLFAASTVVATCPDEGLPETQIPDARLPKRLCLGPVGTYRPRCSRSAPSSLAIAAGGSCPTRGPRRRTSRDLTCSACALDARGKPVTPGSSSVLKGQDACHVRRHWYDRHNTMAERAARAFAPSLLTITTGRRLLASEPRTGSRSAKRISPLSSSQVFAVTCSRRTGMIASPYTRSVSSLLSCCR